MDSWSESVGEIELFDVADQGNEEERGKLVQACRASAAEAKRALICFTVTCERETARRAETLYSIVLAWASDVVDGLWPTTHLGADRHVDDIPEAERDLLLSAAEEIGMVGQELRGLTHGFGPKLGGTGKRY